MKPYKLILVLIILAMFCGVVSADFGFTDYGNGVLYFKNPELGNFTKTPGALNPDTFGEQLSLFVEQHPNLKIITVFVWPDIHSTYNSIDGYYVIVGNKSVNKMMCTSIGVAVEAGVFNYTCTVE